MKCSRTPTSIRFATVHSRASRGGSSAKLSSILASVMMGFVTVTTATAQSKSARPLPPFLADKPAIESAISQVLPSSPPRFAAASARAKSLPAGAPDSNSVRLDKSDLMIDEPGDGRVWVRGVGYKASFGPEGATIVPFLGSDAPRNQPVRLCIATARVGSREIALAPVGIVQHEGRHIVIDRGGMSEVYDVDRDGLEQTLVLDCLPERGALHVEIAIESDLVARESGEGIELSNERGGVRCGRTTVFDAAGSRLDMPSRLLDGRIHVDVPADFVRLAQLPLRIDPVWTTFQIVTSTPDQFYSDVANDASGNWCVVYEELYSATDTDVYALMVYSNQIVVGQTTQIDFTTDIWSYPKVANNNLAHNFLVVASVTPVGGGNPAIKGRTRAAGSVAMGSQLVLSGSEVGAKFTADVGGDPVTVGPTYYLVVYTRTVGTGDRDILARLVNSDGTPAGGTIPIDVSAFSFDVSPRISKSDGNPPFSTQAWNIVWQRADFGGMSDIRGAQVRWDGALITPSFQVESGLPDDTNPVASPPLERASGLRPWMVAWERHMGGGFHHIFGQVLEGGIVKAAADLTVLEGNFVGEDYLWPALECDGLQFALAASQSFQGSGFDFDIFMSSFWYADQTIGVSEGHAWLDASVGESLQPRLASQNSAGLALGGAFMCTWETTTPTFAQDIFAAQYFAPGNGPASAYCSGDGSATACPCTLSASDSGCPNSANGFGAQLSGSGFHRGTVDSFVLTASGVPAFSIGLFFQGTAKANNGNGVAFGDGLLCVGGTLIRLAIKGAQGTSITYPAAGDPSISATGGIGPNGALRTYQVWYRDSNPTFCTPSTFNLTNGYDVVWMP